MISGEAARLKHFLPKTDLKHSLAELLFLPYFIAGALLLHNRVILGWTTGEIPPNLLAVRGILYTADSVLTQSGTTIMHVMH